MLGITQEELARRARMSAKFLSAIENGHSSPTVDVFVRIVELGLGMPLAQFFADGDDDRETAAVRALVARQPVAARRQALRLLRVLFDD